jgi:hypothetical protein
MAGRTAWAGWTAEAPTASQAWTASEPRTASAGRTAEPGFGPLISLGEIGNRIRHVPAGVRARLALAVAAWPPLGLALALAVGELSGCARFAASCTSTSGFTTLVLVAQLVIVAVLLVLTPVARVATFGSLAVLLAALPVVAFLTAVGATYDPELGSASLLAILSVAWGIGVIVGLPRPRRMRT